MQYGNDESLWVVTNDLLTKVNQLQATEAELREALLVMTLERNALQARLRETAQILIAECGAEGPLDAENAARQMVAKYRHVEERRCLAEQQHRLDEGVLVSQSIVTRRNVS